MKIKNISLLLIFSAFYLISIQNVFGLQIKSIHVGNTTTDPAWMEILNDGNQIENLKDYNIINYRMVNTNPHSNHRIDRHIGEVDDFLVEKDSVFFISNSKNTPNVSEKVFYSAFTIAAKGGTLSITNKTGNILSCLGYKLGDCGIPGDNTNPTTTATTSETDTSTKEKIVYVYVPQNNQEKYGDIQLLLPEEKTIPALAEVEYTIKATDSNKKVIDDLNFHWSFGDGGAKTGKDVSYTYTYPGEYILIASADGYTSGGKARMLVKVIKPEIVIQEIGIEEKENFIILKNNTDYDLFLSNFYLSLDNNFFQLPKNLLIAKNKTLKLSGEALGFKLPANKISLLYPNKSMLTTFEKEVFDSDLLNSNPQVVSTIIQENLLQGELGNFILNDVTGKSIPIIKAEAVKEKEGEGDKKLPTNYSTEGAGTVYLRKLVLKNETSLKKVEKTQNIQVKSNGKSKSVDTKIVDWFKNLIY